MCFRNDKIPDLYQGLHLLKEPSPSFPTRFMTVTVERYFVRVFIYQINVGSNFFNSRNFYFMV